MFWIASRTNGTTDLASAPVEHGKYLKLLGGAEQLNTSFAKTFHRHLHCCLVQTATHLTVFIYTRELLDDDPDSQGGGGNLTWSRNWNTGSPTISVHADVLQGPELRTYCQESQAEVVVVTRIQV